LAASAKTTQVFHENFAQENGQYPSSFFVLDEGAVQEVIQGRFVMVGGGEMGFTDHGASLNIPESATQVTCSFKIKSDLNMMSAFVFVQGGQAVQVRFYGDTISASFGGEHDFMTVGTNSGEWTRVIFKVDLVAGVYDLIIDDVTVATDLSVSPQGLPFNILIGTLGTEGEAAFDNIKVSISDK
ncbi:MAG: hypothetical protein AB1Z19_03570, partial [Eubacteriales bacterium]